MIDVYYYIETFNCKPRIIFTAKNYYEVEGVTDDNCEDEETNDAFYALQKLGFSVTKDDFGFPEYCSVRGKLSVEEMVKEMRKLGFNMIEYDMTQ